MMQVRPGQTPFPTRTIEALASRSGLSVNSLRGWEQDQRTPGVLALYRLAKALGQPMERFVEGIEEAPGPEPAKKPRGPKGRKGKK
jgi:transcriptional regulator with XRE-family HTH domain